MRGIIIGTAGLVIGLLGIGLTIFFFMISRPQANLELNTLSSTALAAPGGAVSDRITLRFDGREVNELWLSKFQFANSGNVSIGRGDFDGPLVLSTKGIRIEDVIKEESAPPGIPFQVTKTSTTTVELQPMLLKPAEFITFSILSQTELKDLSVPSRPPIKSIESIETTRLAEEVAVSSTASSSWVQAAIGSAAGAIAALTTSIFSFLRTRRKQ